MKEDLNDKTKLLDKSTNVIIIVSGENETVKEEPNDNIDQNNMELQLNTTEDSDLDTGQDSGR